jgi:hypothetical protein
MNTHKKNQAQSMLYAWYSALLTIALALIDLITAMK